VIRILLVAASAATALGLAAAPGSSARTAKSSYGAYYIEEGMLNKVLEKDGITYRGHDIPVDNASCLGLRRYGSRTSSDGFTETFWRFRCDANGADNHTYDVQVESRRGPKRGFFYTRWLSVRRRF
jgi:hypothetical protein